MDSSLNFSFDFKIEAKSSLCWFCLQHINSNNSVATDNDSTVGLERLNNLFRYLDLDKTQTILELNPCSLAVCGTCDKFLEQLSSLFHLWLEADMKLAIFCVKPLADRLKLKKENKKNMESDSEGSPASEELDTNRKSFKESVKEKCKIFRLTNCEIFKPNLIT